MRRVDSGEEPALMLLSAVSALLEHAPAGTRPPHEQLQHVIRLLIASGADLCSFDSLTLLTTAVAAEASSAAASPTRASTTAGPSRSTAAARGTGYAGGTEDAAVLRAAERKAEYAAQIRDRLLRAVCDDLRSHLPSQFFHRGEAVEDCLVEGTTAVLMEGVDTDKASDHPLLLQLLLMPGLATSTAGFNPAATVRAAVADCSRFVPSAGDPAPAHAAARVRTSPRAPAVPGLTPTEDSITLAQAFDAHGLLTPVAVNMLMERIYTHVATPLPDDIEPVLRGPPTFIRVMTSALRTSMMDMALRSDVHRGLFFSLLQTLASIARHPTMAFALLYTEPSSKPGAASASTATGPASQWKPWFAPRSSVAATHFAVDASGAHGGAVLPPGSVAQLLHHLASSANVFVAGSTRGPVDEYVAAAVQDDASVQALMLAQDANGVWTTVHNGLDAAMLRFNALLEVSYMGPLSSSPLVRAVSDPATGAAAASSGDSSKSAAAPLASLLASMRGVAEGGVDPVRVCNIGRTPLRYAVSRGANDAYVAAMRALAFDTMDLRSSHAANKTAPASSEAAVGSGKRMMRVSAEMAGMPDLATHYASSILIRQDEAHMDFMRAMVTGPADTPYSNGVFCFDIFLPSTYPDVCPKVQFLTTGGGGVRFNPNLYAEGKGQILVDVPYANEPGYDSVGREPSPAVARHNVYLRLATLKTAMLDALRTPTLGFETAVKTHMFLKRREIAQQCVAWTLEAQALAMYELALRAACERTEPALLSGIVPSGRSSAAATKVAAAAPALAAAVAATSTLATATPTAAGSPAPAAAAAVSPPPPRPSAAATAPSSTTPAGAAWLRWKQTSGLGGHNPFYRAVDATAAPTAEAFATAVNALLGADDARPVAAMLQMVQNNMVQLSGAKDVDYSITPSAIAVARATASVSVQLLTALAALTAPE